MIAEVYLIKRMPRESRVFDYLVPENWTTLRRGSFVTVPFRSHTLMGIVKNTKELPERGITLKTLLQQHPEIHFSSEDLSLMEMVAQDLAQSVSSLLNSVIPTFPKRATQSQEGAKNEKRLMIHPQEAPYLKALGESLTHHRKAFVSVSDLRRMTCILAAFMRANPKQKCVVVCPTVLDAERMYAHLPTKDRLLFTGKEAAGKKHAVWKTFKQISSGVLIGTKTALLFADSATTSLFLIRSGSEHHGHHKQNPRYDATTLATLIAETLSLRMIFLDAALRIEDLALFPKEDRLGSETPISPRFIAMDQQVRGSTLGPWIAHEVLQNIEKSLEEGKRILLAFNKKNQAKQLSCVKCAVVVVCEFCSGGVMLNDSTLHCTQCKKVAPILRLCPSCHQPSLREQKLGNQKIDKLLKKEFPQANIAILDKEHSVYDKTCDILIATTYFVEHVFDPFVHDTFSLVVILDTDTPLYQSTYVANAAALRLFEQWRSIAFAYQAEFLVQTRSLPFFLEYATSQEKSLLQEADIRRSYHQPPFCDVIRIDFKESEERKAELMMQQVIQHVRSIATDARIRKQQEKDSQLSLEIRFSPVDRPPLLAYLKTLPDSMRIDTHWFLR